jgi:trans-2,3-dihydro-3-hydroxyanthranilate isomerase
VSDSVQALASWRPLAGAIDSLRYVLLDVFTAKPMQGNQLAVVPQADGLEGAAMQAIAAELKLSETVFALAAQGGGDLRVRIFTPSAELPFAGHPVLGAAVVAAAALERPVVVLETGMGEVRVSVDLVSGLRGAAVMEQPVPTWAPFPRTQELLAALGLKESGLPVEVYENGPRHVYVEAGSRQAVAELEPDLQAILAIVGAGGVSCFAGEGASYKSRMFAPGLGVSEDPATGSAAGPLAVHLLRHGRLGFGEEIEIEQGAEIGRPSLLRARVEGEGSGIERVLVGGDALIVGEGELLVPAGIELPDA